MSGLVFLGGFSLRGLGWGDAFGFSHVFVPFIVLMFFGAAGFVKGLVEGDSVCFWFCVSDQYIVEDDRRLSKNVLQSPLHRRSHR